MPGSMSESQLSSTQSHPFPGARTQLQRRVAWHAVRGATVVYQDEMTTVMVYRRGTNRTAHGVATLRSLGLWVPFWALHALPGRARRRGVVIMIDKYGLVHEETARRKVPHSA